ncbi:hypothetical protein [Desertivirga arenae]|uniref:hypothetical protein n=1 Tax=Desertivirga arenae TaxID=2810309 RepID=UPI001A962BAA|nr:hypothetical protein [Pedobacter sp. SYSU D00823]
MSAEQTKTTAEAEFERKLLSAICKKLIELGEIKDEAEFLEKYPKENLADVHNQETGAYYLMTGEKPLKLVEYNLKTFDVHLISSN